MMFVDFRPAWAKTVPHVRAACRGQVPVHAAPQRQDHRPNNTPAYYLGHPATVWITAMRPHAGSAAAGCHPGSVGP
jgi:hypothetical protein